MDMQEQSVHSMETIGTRLKERRRNFGYSLRDLAEITGVSSSALSAIETDPAYRPSFPVISTIAHALKCRPEWLNSGELPLQEELLGAPTTTLQEEHPKYEQVPDALVAQIIDKFGLTKERIKDLDEIAKKSNLTLPQLIFLSAISILAYADAHGGKIPLPLNFEDIAEKGPQDLKKTPSTKPSSSDDGKSSKKKFAA